MIIELIDHNTLPLLLYYVLQIRNALQIGPLIKGIEVTIATYTHDCFLDTQLMGMCYQTAQQPWSFGNIACMCMVVARSVIMCACYHKICYVPRLYIKINAGVIGIII